MADSKARSSANLFDQSIYDFLCIWWSLTWPILKKHQAGELTEGACEVMEATHTLSIDVSICLPMRGGKTKRGEALNKKHKRGRSRVSWVLVCESATPRHYHHHHNPPPVHPAGPIQHPLSPHLLPKSIRKAFHFISNEMCSIPDRELKSGTEVDGERGRETERGREGKKKRIKSLSLHSISKCNLDISYFGGLGREEG